MNHFNWKHFLLYTTGFALGIGLANFFGQLQTEVNWTEIAFKTAFSSVFAGFWVTYYQMKKHQKK